MTILPPSQSIEPALELAITAGAATAPTLADPSVAVAVNSRVASANSPADVKAPAAELAPPAQAAGAINSSVTLRLEAVEVSARDLDIARQRISARIAPPNANGCTLWMGKMHPKGYGAVKMFGRNWGAHRAAWTIFCGPIPAGICVLHKCDVPACVNTEHLFLGTLADNIADMDSKGRRNKHIPWLIAGNRVRGEDVHGAILTESQVIEIFHRQDAGESYMSLAREFGVGKSTVGSIVTGDNWAHLGLRRKTA